MNRIYSSASSQPPSDTADGLQALARAELSLTSRLAYVGLLLVAAMATAVVLALWITEPSLPLRTQIAFAAMSVVGASWMAFAAWTLRRRRVLLARQRVIAGRMAMTFTAAFLIGAIVAVIMSRAPAAFAAAGTGAVMLGGAIWVHVRARQRLAWLAERRATLERALGATSA